MPEYARIIVSKKLAETIRKMQAAVVELKCYCINMFDDTPEYKLSALEIPDDDRDPETVPLRDWDGRCEYSLLHITSLQFYWRMLVRHTDIYMETDPIDIKELKCL